jgi:hypothetical protein
MAVLQRDELLALRLASHRFGAAGWSRPEQTVAALGAVQAQEVAHAKWALGQRSAAGINEAGVDAALVKRRIVRSWVLRGTLHLVAASDLRWMLALAAPALLTRTAASYKREGLDAAAFRKILPAIRSILEGNRQLTRAGLLGALEQQKLDTAGHRGGLILYRAAQTGLICLGLPDGADASYTLLDEWLPADKTTLPREDALRELALRYFTSHGPAGLADFLWWSGLATGEARQALESAQPMLRSALFDGRELWSARSRPAATATNTANGVGLLAGFDEYLLGYADRSPVMDALHAPKALTANGLFRPTLLVGGRIAATWQARTSKAGLTLNVASFAPLAPRIRRELEPAAERYAAFRGLPLAGIVLA